METIIVDENEDKFSLILRELKLISERLFTIEQNRPILGWNPAAKESEKIEIPKVRIRINSSLGLSKLFEQRSFEASKLVKSAEEINAKAK